MYVKRDNLVIPAEAGIQGPMDPRLRGGDANKSFFAFLTKSVYNTPMQLFYDIIPVLIFFIVYKLEGIYWATFAAILVCLIQMLLYYYRHKKWDMMQVVTFFLLFIFGGATIVFHDPHFLQWKVTVINALFGLALLGTQWIGKKNLIERLLSDKIALPASVFRVLNLAWGFYFIGLAVLNTVAIYYLSLEDWVDFKVFGIIGITVLFVIGQSIYLSKHLHD
jgi:intracellular septation protein